LIAYLFSLSCTSSYDNDVRVWDASTGAMLVRISGHTGDALTVDINDAHTFIASGGADALVRVYGFLTDTSFCTITANTPVNIRTGPGPNFSIVGVLGTGESHIGIGRGTSSDGAQWWQIGASQWVWEQAVSTEGNCDTLPEIQQ